MQHTNAPPIEQHLGVEGRFIFVKNPHGSGELSGRNLWIDRGINWLDSEGYRFEQLGSAQGGWRANSDRLTEFGVTDTDIIVVRGGDGTLGDITEFAVRKKIPVFALPGGGESDGAYSHNPQFHKSPYGDNLGVFKRIIQTGNIATQPIVLLEINDPKKPNSLTSTLYSPTGAGFGVDGRLSNAINSSRNMMKMGIIPPLFARHMRITKAVIESLIASPAINVKMARFKPEPKLSDEAMIAFTKDQSSIALSGLDYVASSQLAGYGHFNTDPEGKCVQVESIGPTRRDILRFTARAYFGRWPENTLTNDIIQIQILDNDLYAQANGDEIRLSAGSILTFSVHENALRYIKAA